MIGFIRLREHQQSARINSPGYKLKGNEKYSKVSINLRDFLSELFQLKKGTNYWLTKSSTSQKQHNGHQTTNV